MKNLYDPPVNKKRRKLNKEPLPTKKNGENTVEQAGQNDTTNTESEQIVNEQSQEQVLNSSDRLDEAGKEEFLD